MAVREGMDLDIIFGKQFVSTENVFISGTKTEFCYDVDCQPRCLCNAKRFHRLSRQVKS